MRIKFRKFGINWTLAVPRLVIQVGDNNKQRYFVSNDNSMGILNIAPPTKELEFKNYSSTPDLVGLSIVDKKAEDLGASMTEEGYYEG